eukprot:CAMPEP_0115340276 /NCGR_PEP_ID=MMETSP0270-20121206/91062_1 /TAXON_ID=71861 /ORGANISM="Scrippsiella trochoidea, Strain CCMP3099" /LENGTH=107 /DNA_ID=CAMNT_0002761723 /DNA_START=96 /DNA_END=415 /DNA_ORIENTATION=-
MAAASPPTLLAAAFASSAAAGGVTAAAPGASALAAPCGLIRSCAPPPGLGAAAPVVSRLPVDRSQPASPVEWSTQPRLQLQPLVALSLQQGPCAPPRAAAAWGAGAA